MDNINNTIILVENNIAEKENFLTLVQGENWNVLTLGSSYEAIQWLKKSNDAIAAIIAEDSAPLNAYQAIDYIRREIKSNLPVLISKNAESGENADGFTLSGSHFRRMP